MYQKGKFNGIVTDFFPLCRRSDPKSHTSSRIWIGSSYHPEMKLELRDSHHCTRPITPLRLALFCTYISPFDLQKI